MSAIKVMLKTHRQKNDGTYPVVIRVYAGRTTFEYTGYSVKQNQFRDAHGKWVHGHPDAAIINNAIEAKRLEILSRVEEGVGYIKNAVPNQKLTSLSEYLLKRAAQFKAADNPVMDSRLRRYRIETEEMQGRPVYFQEINAEWIRLFIAHCKTKYQNGQNTAMRKVVNLRTIYKQAMNDGWAEGPNPFQAYTVKREPVNKTKLSRAELDKIETVPLVPGETLWHARNAFVFAFYCHGMRFESLFTLRKKDIKAGVLEYRMNKGKKIREIKLHPKALAILELYKNNPGPFVFPFCKKEAKTMKEFIDAKGSSNALVNAALKVVADVAGIEKHITMHVARHSFAYLLKTSKVDPHIIKDSLGHTSMSTTEAYLKDLDDDLINEAVNKALG